MPLLLVPFLLLLVVALALLLWPLGLWQRYRHGRARRRARHWVATLQAGALTVSVVLLLAGAWLAGRWIDGALANAALGLAAGAALGVAGVAMTRFEPGPDALHYTPNPWLVLALTLLVAGRALLGAWQAWHRFVAGEAAMRLPWPWLESHASLWAMAGLLLGYHALYAWRLRGRIRTHARRLALRVPH